MSRTGLHRAPTPLWGLAKLTLGIIAICAVLLLLVGCDVVDTHADAPVLDCERDCVNGTHTQVIKMPDGFRNVAFTCYGPNGVYVTSRGGKTEDYGTQQASAVFVLPNDPHCAR